MITLVVEHARARSRWKSRGSISSRLITSRPVSVAKLAMSLQSCPEAVTGKDSPRQHGEIASASLTAMAGCTSPPPYRCRSADATPRMAASATFWVGESGRQRAAIHHGGAVRGEDHVGQVGQRLQRSTRWPVER